MFIVNWRISKIEKWIVFKNIGYLARKIFNMNCIWIKKIFVT